MASAADPALAGTSSTSKIRPVTSKMLDWGAALHHRATTPGSELASSFHAGDSGWAPGAGQPTRSHEHARPTRDCE
jgi:hypothetical protein